MGDYNMLYTRTPAEYIPNPYKRSGVPADEASLDEALESLNEALATAPKRAIPGWKRSPIPGWKRDGIPGWKRSGIPGWKRSGIPGWM